MTINDLDQPMTPTEALEQAIEQSEWHMDDPGDYDECPRPTAAAVLAALPPGYRLVGPDDVTVTVDGLAVQRAMHKTIGPSLPHRYAGDADPFCEHLASTFLAILAALSASTPLDLDGKLFCPTGYAQRYHDIGECSCVSADKEGQK